MVMMVMMVIMNINMMMMIEHDKIIISSYLQEEGVVSRRVEHKGDGGQSLHSDGSEHGVAARPCCYPCC